MSDGFVQTKASKKLNVPDFQNVTFISHKSKKKTKSGNNSNSLIETPLKRSALHMQKLRYEVIKFGTNGLQSDDKTASSIALAVSLGAKPPKKECKNYKELIDEKKKQKIDGSVKNTRLKSKLPENPARSPHLFVVGNKVIPSKQKAKNGAYKNFLHRYGTVSNRRKNIKD